MMNVAKLFNDISNDLYRDHGEVDYSVAYDTADCLLHDSEILEAVKKRWGNKPREILVEIVADQIA